jgi:hypothetical protein
MQTWIVNYKGYQFEVDSPTEPTEQQAQWLYEDYVRGSDSFIQDSTSWLHPAQDTLDTLPGLDFGYVETDLERAQRNAREVGSSVPDQEYRDATFMGRFWDSAKASAIPFGKYESQLSPPDESSELWASALGGLVGAVPSFILASAVTGGVGGIAATGAKGAKAVSTFRKFLKAKDSATKARKMGKIAQAERFENLARKLTTSKSQDIIEAVAAKEMPHLTGALGRIKPYRNKILKIAEKNPKLARSLNLFSNNVVAFNLYGQTRFPLDRIEGRLESLTADTAAGIVFSVAGLPTMVGATSKGVKYALEPGMLLGAGMYSDLLQTDMSMEERFIHGAALFLFHYARQGLSRAHIKEKLETAIRTTIPEISDAGIKNIKDGKGINKLFDSVGEVLATKELSKMHFQDLNVAGRSVRILRVFENKKVKKARWEVLYEDIADGAHGRITGPTREQAVLNFGEKFQRHALNIKQERVLPRELDSSDEKILKDLETQEKHYRDAIGSGRRDYTVVDIGERGAPPEIKSPFKDKSGVREIQSIEKKIADFEAELVQKRAERDAKLDKATNDGQRSSIKWQYNKDKKIIDNTIESLKDNLFALQRSAVKEKNVEFMEGPEVISRKTGEITKSKGDVPEHWQKGDYVKIPLWNENTKSFDYSTAGIGKYVGKMSDFKKGEVIVPEGLRAEFVAENYPVFEVRTHGGSQVQKIAIGTKMPQSVREKINNAKNTDRPDQAFESQNPELVKIKEQPIMVERDGVLVYNENSPLFSKLFTDKLRGRDAKERAKEAIEVPSERTEWSFELQESIKVPTTKTYYPKSKGTLKNTSKLLEKGVTPESSRSFEESYVQKVRETLSKEREKAREDWERLRNIDEQDPNSWYDMNQMRPNTLIDKKAYESYPEFDPLNEKPFTVTTEYDRVVNGVTEPVKMGEAKLDGKPLRFKTRKEAEDWATTHWMSNEGVESQIKIIADKKSNMRDETVEFRKEQNKFEKTKRESGVNKNEFEAMVKLFFPKSEGKSSKMTYEEIVSANALFVTKDNTITFENKLSSTVPPEKFMSKVDAKWRKFLYGVAKITLPTYTVLGMAKSKAAQILAGKQIDFELTRQAVSGQVEQWKADLRKIHLSKNPIKNQKQFEALSSVLDGKYKDFYDPILDGLPLKDIINSYQILSDGLMVAMIQSGVEAKNSRKNGKEELLFEAYDKNGTLIQLEVPWDALRVVKGYEFLDSRGNSKKPSDLKELEYLKSLRQELETGEFDNGWFIVGKERFIPEWKGDKFIKFRKLSSKEVDVADGRKNVKMYEDSKAKKPGFKNHIQENYLMRMVTDEFRNLVGMDENFRHHMAEKISRTDPEFIRMKGTPQEKFEAALAHVEAIKQYWLDGAGVFGTQWTRIAELPPVVLIEKGTNRIIEVETFKDINGKPVKKGSTIIDKAGNKREVGRSIDVYERNFDKIVTRYGQKVAHIIPTYKYFGRGGARNDGETANLLARLTLETNESFSDWAKSQLELQVNSTQKNKLMEKVLTHLTMGTAQIGLSSPISGVKNLILGQTFNATVYGFRGAVRGLYETFSNFSDYSSMTSLLGGKEAGVHALMTGRVRYTKYSPGLMRPTEIVNRIVSVAAAKPMLETHINNLNNIKTPMNRGISKKTSLRTLTEVFKFTTAEVKDMMSLGVEKLHYRKKYIDKARQMSHLITQGGPSLPFVPKWMGKWWSKPLTLFYRVAYRMSENVYNSVAKPAIVDGNPVPLLRYVTLVPLAGQALYSMYYGILGEEARNRFKTMPEEYWAQFIRAEGLGILSNGADEFGTVVESYKPAVYRAVTSLYRETSATIQGKKKVEQSLEDLAKENIVFLNHATRVVRRFTAPIEKKVEASRRRQRQFSDVYFRAKPTFGDELDFLTTRSPFYRTVKESFWADDPDIKARAYYSALNYVIHDEIKKDPALIKQPHKARKMAKSILKSTISRMRPIPSSWRKKTTGKKTRYQLYYSKLNPEFQQEELELDKLYKQKVRDFNSAISQYKNIYGMDAIIAPTER